MTSSASVMLTLKRTLPSTVRGTVGTRAVDMGWPPLPELKRSCLMSTDTTRVHPDVLYADGLVEVA
jgi:hypothetical protein